MRPLDHITYFSLILLSRGLKSLSIFARTTFSKRLASFLYHHVPVRKKTALRNIQKAFPDKQELWHKTVLKSSYMYFSKNFIEFLSSTGHYTLASETKQELDKTLEKRKGIIMVTGHFGPWEIMMDWLGKEKYPLHVVINRQRNSGADRFFKELREKNGTHHIYRKEPLEVMYNVLKNGHILGLASDQDAKKRGVFVNFLGRPSSTPKGVARFYQQSKAPILFCVGQEISQHKILMDFILVEPPENATIQEITQMYTVLLEQKIRETPEQYFWFHRRWKTKPE